MKVAYLDFYVPLFEDYALKPKRYGGGRIFASLLKQHEWFDIFCAEECANNISKEDRKEAFHFFSKDKRDLALQGYPIINLIPELANYDIIVSCYTNVKLNLTGLKAKYIVWSVGYNEDIHECQEHLMIYNDYQHPKIKGGLKTKIHKFVLGKPIEDFVEREKSNFIFQCTRHCPEFCSIEVAYACNQAGIKAYFAGPINPDYPLLKYINNVNTFYLGQIDEDTKMHFTKKARLYSLVHNWPTPFNLSAIEALSVGTPIVTTNIGFWPSLIKQGVNGFFTYDVNGIIDAYNKAPSIFQRDCYESALPYSNKEMEMSIVKCFENVIKS